MHFSDVVHTPASACESLPSEHTPASACESLPSEHTAASACQSLHEQTATSVRASLHENAVEDTPIDEDVQMEEPSYDDELANLMASLTLGMDASAWYEDDSSAIQNPYALQTHASAYESLHQEHTPASACESLPEEQTTTSVRASLPIDNTVEDTLIHEDVQMEESCDSMSQDAQFSNPMPSLASVVDAPVGPAQDDSFAVPVPMRQYRSAQAASASVPLPDDDDEPAAGEDTLEAGVVQADDALFIGNQPVFMPSAATREDTPAVQPNDEGIASFWFEILQRATVLDEEVSDLLSAANPDIPATTITSATITTQPATATAVGSAPLSPPSPSGDVDVDAVRFQLQAEADEDNAWFDELIGVLSCRVTAICAAVFVVADTFMSVFGRESV
ncbi:hypothetical protein BDB00DRAFT_929114 [Zychaea mexicana]|uniref:uncharacterized protein n=1 Tax=Zychaea mexicana TaxID=64656 RepID=UPI0022FDCFC8|nr:uncharacterized protein BDB00DRAFT_929114 [Zychaea mexicana]KAI9493240.1 hypothetical protein BDB00DRAFT_929114 [Zychaea mexicana]